MKHVVRPVMALLMLVLATIAQARPGPGDVPPDYLGRDRDGHEVRISALRGKVVVVSFWASWCGYCRKELPVLAALQQLKGTKDLVVIGVNHDDDYDKFKELRRRWKNLDIVLTYDAPDNRISKPYQIKGLPFMVMIDRDGRIAEVYTGYGEDSQNEIMGKVNDLLEQPASPAAASNTAESPST